MAIKEARCTNCGSILSVDPAVPTAKCLFCRAVVDTAEALEVAADPAGYVFTNEPQPEEDTAENPASLYNKALKQAQSKPAQGVARTAAAKKAPPRAPKPDNAPRAQVEKVEMPAVKLSGAAKLKIVAFLAALFLLVTAAVLPVTLVRDAHRASLSEKIDGVIPFEYAGEQSWAIERTGNYRFSVVATEPVNASDALDVFRRFSAARAEVYGLDPDTDSFARIYGKVTVRVIGPDGGFEVSGLRSADELQDTGKVRVLG